MTDAKFWTALPPISLRGMASSCPESLEHYVSRLVWVCGTRPRWLIDFRHDGFPRVSRICGPSMAFIPIMEGLKRLTGCRDLHCGTFYNLGAIVANGAHGLTSPKRRWCPHCIAEWDDEVSYESLSWSMPLVFECTIHGCLFESQCAACGSDQKQGVSYEKRRICRKCNASLGGPGRFQVSSHYSRWAQEQAIGLLEYCSIPDAPRISSHALHSFTLEVARELLQSADVSESTRCAVQPFADVSNPRLDIEVLLNLCALQGVSAIDALRGPVESSSRPFEAIWETFQALDVRSASAQDRSEAFGLLIKELPERWMSPLPSAWMLAEQFGLVAYKESRYMAPSLAYYSKTCADRAGGKAMQKQVDKAFGVVIDYLRANVNGTFIPYNALWVAHYVLAESPLGISMRTDLARQCIHVFRQIKHLSNGSMPQRKDL